MRVDNVVAPAHLFAEHDGGVKRAKVHLGLREGISGGGGPVHKSALVLSIDLEINNPVLADVLVGGVAVHVLLLIMVDASNSLSLKVTELTGVAHSVSRAVCSLIELWALVVADLVMVNLGTQHVGRLHHALALDGTIL